MASDDLLQNLSRSAGLSAYLVIWFDMCLGVALSGHSSIGFVPPWRVGDLHQFTSLIGLGFLLAHICVLVGLSQQAFTIPELLIPGVRHINPLAPVLGITGFYVLILVAIISHARRFVGIRLWRMVHRFSFVGFVLALFHAVGAGPDASVTWVSTMYIGTFAILVALSLRRICKSVRV